MTSECCVLARKGDYPSANVLILRLFTLENFNLIVSALNFTANKNLADFLLEILYDFGDCSDKIKKISIGEDRMRYLGTRKLSSGGDYRTLKIRSCSYGENETDHGQGGFTLVELLTVSAILGLIMAIAIPSYNQFIVSVKITKAVAELSAMERDIVAYEVDKGTLPDSLSDFGRDTLLDPWGRPYVYLKLTAPNTARNDTFNDLNAEFDCYSVGEDGLSARLLNDPVSLDDVVRGADGAFYGLASTY